MAALHKVRESLVRDKVKITNQMHGFLLEFGVSLPKGSAVIKRLSLVLIEHELPPCQVQLLMRLHAYYLYLITQIDELEKVLTEQLAADKVGQNLLSIPAIGAITASLLASEIGDGKPFASSRDFAASIGLVPRQYSTGGKATLMGSASGETKICADCWCSVPGYLCCVWRIIRAGWLTGSKNCDPVPFQCGGLCTGK
ncbi:transposase for insertion sequence element IS1328 [Yersinia enterocolitica]|nr:transposase for insertion sequence element IS1328 [Yersinia enterocolitica]CRX51441.1 transposase for insertion sequence element IS1328 [Yersinia enterocolitica]SQA41341.1 transposase for insertion sequence element IS1328 [Yersinia enterocolitica]SUP66834.1 transposase for insertion sequence element IS1328 [Yersinia enterocolitica]